MRSTSPKNQMPIRVTRLLEIYELRMFRRETLLWINLRNRCPTPFSRSPILQPRSCNCSSQTITFFLWNVLETSDCLGTSICFDKRCTVDSSRETVISLALVNSLTIPQFILMEVAFLVVLWKCLPAFFTKRAQDWILAWIVASSPFLRATWSYWTMEFSSTNISCMVLQRSPATGENVLSLLPASSSAGRSKPGCQLDDLLNSTIDVRKPPQTITHRIDGIGWRDGCL